MPELPEVETIRLQLQSIIPFKITGIRRSPFLAKILKEEQGNWISQKIIKINRQGKYLLLIFESGQILLSHLGMSGSWRISSNPLNEKHIHLELRSHKLYLSYIDPRRFGRMFFVTDSRAKEILSKLGTDISSPQFNLSYLKAVFKKHPNRVLKPFLLEQKYFSGIGNYIASEVLARAHLHPARPIHSLVENDLKAILEATASVLHGSLKYQGLTFNGGYKDTLGLAGEGLKNLVVFHQKICGLCGKEEVKKIIQQNRSTFFCPRCQK